MKLHEYQAKALLAKCGVPVPRGGVASTPQEAREVARRLAGPCVVKAQVHAGGRGKAGGVRRVTTLKEAQEAAAAMLGSRLVTAQTGPEGAPVSQVLIEEALEVETELYLSIVIDAGAQSPVVLASSAGGMDVEEIAAKHPDTILKEVVNPVVGFQPFQGRRLAMGIGVSAGAARAVSEQIAHLYQSFMDQDCSLVEVNPMVITKDGRVVALDAKVSLDDDALFRHPDLAALRDWSQEDPLESSASKAGIAYVKLKGDVGCLVNGAGLAMATMDIVKAAGCQPANFLDVGGGADPAEVAQAVSIILQDPQVSRVLVNVFGGIARCDDISRGIVQAVPKDRKSMHIVVRFLGTNLEEGKQILRESGLNVSFVNEMAEATRILKEMSQS